MLWRSLTQRGVSGAMALAVVSTAVATLAAPGGVHAAEWPHGASIATTTTLSSSQNPSQFGDAVTLTATVRQVEPRRSGERLASNDTAAGTLGTGVLDANGRASFSTSALSGGSHSIVAAFAGDSSVAPSAGSLRRRSISGPTDTTLTSSSNPSLLGASVTFTATVVSGGGPVTGGDVTFLLDSAVLGTVPVTDGVRDAHRPGRKSRRRFPRDFGFVQRHRWARNEWGRAHPAGHRAATGQRRRRRSIRRGSATP